MSQRTTKNHTFNFVYCTTNTVNGHFYIGVHQTDNMDDGYLGSGKRLHYAIEKYGKENFKRRIIKMCDSPEMAYQIEAFLVTQYIVSREDCYNIVLGGHGGYINKETYEAVSEDMKKNNPAKNMTDEWRRKIGEASKGRKWNEEQRRKASERMKANNPMKNKETAKKVSETKKGKFIRQVL